MLSLEDRTQAIGLEVFTDARRSHASLSPLNRWTQEVLTWCLADARVKFRILRFLDVLPSLRSPRTVVRHLHEHFPRGELRLPPPLRLGLRVSEVTGLLTAPAAAATVRALVEQVARQFIAGTTDADAVAVLQRLGLHWMLASFDVLGEQVLSDGEAAAYGQRYVSLLTALAEAATEPADTAEPALPRLHVSIKPSSLTPHFDPLTPRRSLERAMITLQPVLREALRRGAAITLDMEQYELRDLTLALAKRALEQADAGERAVIGIVLQAYLKDSERALDDTLAWLAQRRGRLAVRLVKGAYWDSEVAAARQRNWPSPVHVRKSATDAAFERLTHRLLAAGPQVQPAIASHNVRSIAYAMAVWEERGRPPGELEFQVLYGMGEAIAEAIRGRGYPVRVYAPLGELLPGMGYLVRRILENTANESFLRQDRWAHVDTATLLAAPTGGA